MNYLHVEAPVTIIHRDLKPANILVFPGNTLKARPPAPPPSQARTHVQNEGVRECVSERVSVCGCVCVCE
jgi:serine/threonine protein kinase